MSTIPHQFEIISQETIRPSSATPPHLRSYKLTLLDQLTTQIFIPIILFYSGNNSVETASSLKDSLSQTLTIYYPFAGRLADNVTIDCNDDGVDFIEAKTDHHLSEFLKDVESSEHLSMLCPLDFLWKDSSQGSLIGIQATYFKGGGLVIALCICHKISDGSTISNFLRDWARMATDSGDQVLPEFLATSLPQIQSNQPYMVPEIELGQKKCATKRFVFEASKIAQLKAMAKTKNPTTVEVVTAFVFKCALASSKALLIQMVNMRQRMDPPLPTNSPGNFTWYITAIANNGRETEFSELVNQLRNGILQLCDKEKNNMNVHDWMSEVVMESMKDVKVLFDNLEVYRCSSFCGFSLHQVDFGIGKPFWVTMANGVVKNTFVLMDTPKGDGVEVHVTLEEEDMVIFQKNAELIEFAYPNSVILV